MNNELLSEAKANRSAARVAYNEAATKVAQRVAAENLEFWGRKVAMLSVSTGWA